MALPIRRGDETERAFWRRVLEEGDRKPEDLGHAQALMEAHGAIADTIERARHYGDMARDALAIFPASELKAAMLESVDFCIARVN